MLCHEMGKDKAINCTVSKYIIAKCLKSQDYHIVNVTIIS